MFVISFNDSYMLYVLVMNSFHWKDVALMYQRKYMGSV